VGRPKRKGRPALRGNRTPGDMAARVLCIQTVCGVFGCTAAKSH
jgi:hypothetical protein